MNIVSNCWWSVSCFKNLLSSTTKCNSEALSKFGRGHEEELALNL